MAAQMTSIQEQVKTSKDEAQGDVRNYRFILRFEVLLAFFVMPTPYLIVIFCVCKLLFQ
ncbi:unnamed protein product [Trifolium pratense]|uniref:Uncharacterized protein n=1 Tax=Trifolium pratense TaxID=57577 RepID=A0ACB0KDU1_TRIPR|nr:unnamed protein product [Trifolium pratense]